MANRTAVYSDIDMELNKQNDGDIQRDVELDAVINSLENIVSTMQGSRRMLPDFAIDIHNLLFEPLDDQTANLIGNKVVDAIELWDDRIEIIELHIVVDYENNLYRMRLDFTIRPTDEVAAIDFVLIAL